MHIHEYADLARFDEIAIGGTLEETEKYRGFIKKLHPTQMLTGRLTAPFYEVEYSYMTARDNVKRKKKYVLLRIEHDDLDLEIQMMLEDWVEEHNHKYPYRKISNVDILGIRPIAYATITFEV